MSSTIRLKNNLLAAALALGLVFGSSASWAAPQDNPMAAAAAPTEPEAKALYWSGHEALAAGDWNLAVQRFRQLEGGLRRSNSEGVDAALYWQAYALDAGKRGREAARVAVRLERDYPQSRWRAEAVKFMSAADAAAAPGREREADALMALDALMTSANAKAVPTLERVLASDHSERVKKRALFVLSQIDAGAANRALDRILAGDGSPRLKREAVQQIAIGGNAASLEKLVALYPKSDPQLRRAILNAYMVAGRGDLLAKVARSETDPQMQEQAIRLLGAQGDRAALKALYADLKDPDARAAAIEAMGISGDSAGINEILRSAQDPQTQRAALRALGISGDKSAPQAIVQLYQRSRDEQVRRSAVQALLVAGDGASLLALYKQADNRDEKRDLLRALQVTDPDLALDVIDEQL